MSCVTRGALVLALACALLAVSTDARGDTFRLVDGFSAPVVGQVQDTTAVWTFRSGAGDYLTGGQIPYLSSYLDTNAWVGTGIYGTPHIGPEIDDAWADLQYGDVNPRAPSFSDGLFMNPGDGTSGAAVVVFRAPTAMTIGSINARIEVFNWHSAIGITGQGVGFQATATLTGAESQLFARQVIEFTTHGTFSSFDSTSPLVLAAGDLLTFTVDSNGNRWNDWTNLGLTIVSSTTTPIPEPITLALFGLGAVGLAAVRRRRRSS